MGGGSGVRPVVAGLSRRAAHIIAVCTVFDNGGSTGRLRREFGGLALGDLRNVFASMIPPKHAFWEQLFNFRFASNGHEPQEVGEHNLGNLIFLGAKHLLQDDIVAGIAKLSQLFEINGEVWPVSIDSAHLIADLSDGSVLRGESEIDLRGKKNPGDLRTIHRVHLSQKAFACGEAITALASADKIVLGPGDLYTSIVPHLLVEGIPEFLNNYSGKLIYVCNLMTKRGETPGYTAGDFVETLYRYGITRPLDAVVLNTDPVPSEIRARYLENEGAAPVEALSRVIDSFARRTKTCVTAALLSRNDLSRGLIRHDPTELSRTILTL